MNRSTHAKGAHLDREAGFALVTVLWIATLLAVVALVFTTALRAYVREQRAELAAAEAEALAEAGVNLAILDLIGNGAAKSTGRYPVNGAAQVCTLPSGDALAIAIRDEAGRVDLNIAGEPLLTALLIGLGLTEEDAARRAAAIADFRDADDLRRPGGAELGDYQDAGRMLGPKNAPFAAVDELARVLGFDNEFARRIAPFVTLHSEQDGLDPAAAAPQLAAMLARGAAATATFDIASTDALDTIPEAFSTPSAGRAFRVAAEVRTRRGARHARETVVRLVEERTADRGALSVPGVPGERRKTYRTLRWQRGERFAAEALLASPPVTRPPC